MKKRGTILSALTLCTALFAGCQSDALTTYEGYSSIYFDMKTPHPDGVYSFEVEYDGKTFEVSAPSFTRAQDAITFSFALHAADHKKDTTVIPLAVMGFISGKERKAMCKASGTSTAVEGVHYRILDAFVPAGETRGAVIIEMDRSSMGDEVVNLDLTLLAGNDFNVDYPLSKRGGDSDETVSTLDFTLHISTEFTRPPNWVDGYFGAFSKKKLQIMINELDIPQSFFYGSSQHTAIAAAYGGMLKRWLAQQKAAGNTIYEEDGVTEMVAGSQA